jgi:hypothetical protein
VGGSGRGWSPELRKGTLSAKSHIPRWFALPFRITRLNAHPGRFTKESFGNSGIIPSYEGFLSRDRVSLFLYACESWRWWAARHREQKTRESQAFYQDVSSDSCRITMGAIRAVFPEGQV